MHISQDMGGLLSQVYNLFAEDIKGRPFDWIDSASRELHTLANCSIQPEAQGLLASKDFDKVIELIFKAIKVKPDNAEEKELIERVL